MSNRLEVLEPLIRAGDGDGAQAGAGFGVTAVSFLLAMALLTGIVQPPEGADYPENGYGIAPAE